jgi:hypothetical protein
MLVLWLIRLVLEDGRCGLLVSRGVVNDDERERLGGAPTFADLRSSASRRPQRCCPHFFLRSESPDHDITLLAVALGAGAGARRRSSQLFSRLRRQNFLG